jgi:hypothetical protein
MEGREMPHMNRFRGIRNGWNYVTTYMHTPLLVSELEYA